MRSELAGVSFTDGDGDRWDVDHVDGTESVQVQCRSGEDDRVLARFRVPLGDARILAASVASVAEHALRKRMGAA
jgi:hypothetical protein